MIVCPNTPWGCGVNPIILLLPIELEPPRSRIANIKCVWYFPIPHQAATDKSPTIVNKKEHTSTVHTFNSTYICLLRQDFIIHFWIRCKTAQARTANWQCWLSSIYFFLLKSRSITDVSALLLLNRYYIQQVHRLLFWTNRLVCVSGGLVKVPWTIVRPTAGYRNYFEQPQRLLTFKQRRPVSLSPSLEKSSFTLPLIYPGHRSSTQADITTLHHGPLNSRPKTDTDQ